MPYTEHKKRPARAAWEKSRAGIIATFLRQKSDACQKLLLSGSVARGEDDERSDIDLVILTWKGCDLAMMYRIVEAINNENPCAVPLHLVFWPLGMEDAILKAGGQIICQ